MTLSMLVVIAVGGLSTAVCWGANATTPIDFQVRNQRFAPARSASPAVQSPLRVDLRLQVPPARSQPSLTPNTTFTVESPTSGKLPVARRVQAAMHDAEAASSPRQPTESTAASVNRFVSRKHKGDVAASTAASSVTHAAGRLPSR